MKHVVLLGDSIFDNAAYVRGGPDVVAQLREALPAGWRATLAAVDGAVVGHVEGQLRRAPDDADFLVVSAGGNDALAHVDILGRGTRSMADALDLLAGIAGDFERRYRAMVRALLAPGLPAAVCTVYYPRFPDADEQRLAVTALTVFNDAILRVAFEAGLPVLDLRLVCDEDADYANPIEPSSHGGAKIARAITRLVTGHDWAPGRTAVFTR
ncbi:MAG TPA: SGNH/GDSL hydrolase family protein [Longimicrobiaceae bacterium]|nr:SGNH/GDSL hydrolase family protein [Longimicrobiaceae bacterium]